MVWGLYGGDVLRVIVPEGRGSRDVVLAVARSMRLEQKPAAVFTLATSKNARNYAENLGEDGKVYTDGASRDVDFILSQMRYGHPKLVIIEGYAPKRAEVERLQSLARREEAVIVIVTEANRTLDADEFAAHLESRLPPEKAIEEL